MGSRDYPRMDIVPRYVREIARRWPDAVVISGGARGVDRLAAETARECGLPVVEFFADWSKGRGAGIARNSQIVAAADHLVAFWDERSTGTADSIRKAQAAGLRIAIYGADGERIVTSPVRAAGP